MLAGEVTAVLGAKVNPAGFAAYDAAVSKVSASAAKGEAASAKLAASFARTGAAASSSAAAAARQAVALRQAALQSALAEAAEARRAVAVARAGVITARSATVTAEYTAAMKAEAVQTALNDQAQARRALAMRTAAVEQARANVATAKATAAAQANTAALGTGTAATGRFASVARTGAAAGAVVLAAALAKSVSVAASFEQQMDRVKAVTQANGQQMRQMTTIARDLGKKTGLGATEAARGLEALAKGGLTTKQIIGGGLAGALALAQAGSMDVAAAAETTANALNLFGMEGGKATHVADALATAANATTADVSDFAMALSQGGSAAKIAGLSFDETIVALEALAKMGVKGSDAGTSLKSALLQTVNPTDKAAAAMKQYGLDFTDASGKMKPLGTVAEMLQTKLGGLSKEQKIAALQAMAGTDGFRALAALMEQGGTGVEKLSGGLKRSGEAARVAKENTDNLKGAWDRFKAQMQDIAISFGTPMLEGLTDGLDGISRWLDRLGDNEDAKQLASDIGAIADKVAGFFDAINAGEGLQTMFSGLLEQITGFVHALRSLMEGDLSGVFDGLKQAFQGWIQTMIGPLQTIGLILVPPFASAISTITGLLSGLVGAFGSVMGTLAKVPGPMQGAFRAAAVAADVAQDKMNALGDAAERAGDRAAGMRAINEALEDLPDNQRLKIQMDGDQEVLSKVGQILNKVKGTPDEKRIKAIIEGDAPVKVKLKALDVLAAGVSPAIVKAIVTGNSSVKVKLAALDAIARGMDPAAVRAIVVGAGSAKQKLAELADAVRGVPDVNVAVNLAAGNAFAQIESLASRLSRLRSSGRAQGRGPGDPEVALTGEGRHAREAIVSPKGGWSMIVDRPTVMPIPADAYVIPEDPLMRGRSMGLLSMLAEDLGLRGFKGSKKPAKRTKKSGPLGLPLPGNVTPTALPLEELEIRFGNAVSARDRAKYLQSEHREQAREKKDGKLTKAARRAKAKADEDRKRLTDAKAALAAAKKLRDQARRFQAQITRQETLADTAADAMRLANDKGDRAGYEAARGTRSARLDALRKLIVAARLALKDQKGQAALDLGKRLGEIDLDINDTGTAAFDVPDPAADEALSEAEKHRLKELDRDVALAALTEGLDDDKTRASAREQFLSGLLNAAVGQGRSAEVVEELAGMVKTARENVAPFTDTTKTNDNQDLQAQLDQANERARVADLNARQNTALWSAWNSPGDIGGGLSVTVNQNMLTGADPRVAQGAANAVVAGIGYQAGVPSPRTRVA